MEWCKLETILNRGCGHEDWKKVLNSKHIEVVYEKSHFCTLEPVFSWCSKDRYWGLDVLLFLLTLLLSLSLWHKHWQNYSLPFYNSWDWMNFRKRTLLKDPRKNKRENKVCKHIQMCLRTPSDKHCIDFWPSNS